MRLIQLACCVALSGCCAGIAFAQLKPPERATRIGIGVSAGRSWLSSMTDAPNARTSPSSSDAIELRVDHDLRPRLALRVAIGLSARDADASRLYILPTAIRLRTRDLIGGVAWTAWRRGRLRTRLTTEVALSVIDSMDVLSLDKRFIEGSIPSRAAESSVILGTELLIDTRYPIAFALMYRHGLTVVSEPNTFRARSFDARINVYPFAR